MKNLLLFASLLLDTLAFGQPLAYLNQFATLTNSSAADDTGSYLLVDSTLQLFPSSTLYNKAITLRKFSNATGAEEWSREIWTNANTALGLTPLVALDPSGIYVAYAEPVSGGGRTPVVRKYNREGAVLWTQTLSNIPSEGPAGLLLAHGVIYVATVSQTGQIYRLDPNTGTTISTSPFSFGWPNLHMTASANAVFVVGGFAANNIFAFDLNGTPIWQRQLADGQTVALAQTALVYGDSLYVGGEPINTSRSILQRFDFNGNLLNSVSIATASTGNTRVRSLIASSSGILLGGSASGAIPGSTQIGTRDLFLQNYTANLSLLNTTIIGSSGVAFNNVKLATVGPSLQIAGTAVGNWPGNSITTPQSAFLARYTLPVITPPSLSEVLDTIQAPSINGFKGRVNSICQQLDNLRRDIESNRSNLFSSTQKDAAAASIATAQTALGCTQ